MACAIIGTLEYVDATLPQLCETFQTHISADFHHQLDFDSEQEVLGSLTSVIYQDVLVKSCETPLEGIICKVQETKWAYFNESAAVPSNYVGEIQTGIYI